MRRTEADRRLVKEARAAVRRLRDAAREGRVIHFLERDVLVMDVHRALDAFERRLEGEDDGPQD